MDYAHYYYKCAEQLLSLLFHLYFLKADTLSVCIGRADGFFGI